MGKSLSFCGPIESPSTQSDQLLERSQSVEHLLIGPKVSYSTNQSGSAVGDKDTILSCPGQLKNCMFVNDNLYVNCQHQDHKHWDRSI